MYVAYKKTPVNRNIPGLISSKLNCLYGSLSRDGETVKEKLWKKN
jgi:hypothetical protein